LTNRSPSSQSEQRSCFSHYTRHAHTTEDHNAHPHPILNKSPLNDNNFLINLYGLTLLYSLSAWLDFDLSKPSRTPATNFKWKGNQADNISTNWFFLRLLNKSSSLVSLFFFFVLLFYSSYSCFCGLLLDIYDTSLILLTNQSIPALMIEDSPMNQKAFAEAVGNDTPMEYFTFNRDHISWRKVLSAYAARKSSVSLSSWITGKRWRHC